MSVWGGWEADLLTHSGIPNTANNRRFLDDWHSHAETNCRRNPVDLSVKSAGASNCHSLPGVTARAQNYSTTGNAVHAWDTQIHQSGYKALLAAMMTGDPYTASNTGQASQDLTAWGSQTFAHTYFNETGGAPGRGGGGGTVRAPHALNAWADLRTTMNRGLPSMLRTVSKLNRQTSRQIARKRRVKH